MKILCLSFVVFAGFLGASCSEKSDVDRDAKPKTSDESSASEGASALEADSKKEDPEVVPAPDEIGEDCVAFLRATKAVPAQRDSSACPTCPASDATYEVLKFQTFEIEKAALSGSNCEVAVRIHAQFNPSAGGTIVGGLTGWISPAEKEEYARGKTPSGEQIYKVKVTYRRTGLTWQAIEFDRDQDNPTPKSTR